MTKDKIITIMATEIVKSTENFNDADLTEKELQLLEDMNVMLGMGVGEALNKIYDLFILEIQDTYDKAYTKGFKAGLNNNG